VSESGGRAGTRSPPVAAERADEISTAGLRRPPWPPTGPAYMSVLLLIRAICEIFAAVWSRGFVIWIGDEWRAVLSASSQW